MNAKELEDHIFSTKSFEEKALNVFQFQAQHCNIYKAFLNGLGIEAIQIKSIADIPFLPISFFRTHKVTAGRSVQKTFLSSGSTSEIRSKHHIHNLSLYERSILEGFNQFFGSSTDYCLIALLPGYGDADTSSLSYMCEYLIQRSTHKKSGFYLKDLTEIHDLLNENEERGVRSILFGVTYALLDLAEHYTMKLNNTIVLETGGMKGNRPELSKKEVHSILSKALNLEQIGSEYGMTEMQSQAYSHGQGLFHPSATLKVVTTEIQDALSLADFGELGVINVIDLANIYSCSFIATEDLGILNTDGSFELKGRAQNADIRGCNLMLFDQLN